MLILAEYADPTGFGSANANGQVVSTTPQSGTVSAAESTVLWVCGVVTNGAPTFTPGTNMPWVSRQAGVGAPSRQGAFEDAIAAGAQTAEGRWTLGTSQEWLCSVATFTASA